MFLSIRFYEIGLMPTNAIYHAVCCVYLIYYFWIGHRRAIHNKQILD